MKNRTGSHTTNSTSSFSAGLVLLLGFSLLNCNGQVKSYEPSENKESIRIEQRVGGPFENSEYMYIGMPEQLKATDTSPGWNQAGRKLLIKGRILKKDGKTAAPNVVIYYYHTDINGYYSPSKTPDPHVTPHGYIRGWVKSDAQGNYAIYTVRPAAYPNSNEPAHIHPAILEPGIANEYYIDAFVFDDDSLLSREKRQHMENRGGSGILKTRRLDSIDVAEHNIILGLNIPNYPKR